jgi:hypothetical protein
MNSNAPNNNNNNNYNSRCGNDMASLPNKSNSLVQMKPALEKLENVRKKEGQQRNEREIRNERNT